MFSVDRLRALDSVRRLGSVTAAATELHVTPSGISQQLVKLERESGHRLTEPDGRGIRLTQAGLVLADHATRVLDQLAAAEMDLADLHADIVGPLRIGAVDSATRALLAPALTGLREQHPRLLPTLSTGEPVVTLPMLYRGDLDVVVVENWDNQPITFAADVTHARLLRETTSVALSGRHPLADRDPIDLADLADTPWVSCFPGSGAHDSLVQAMRGVGVEPEVTCVAGEYPTQLALVAANVVAAFVPPLGLAEPVPGVRLLPCRPAIEREILAVWRSDRERPATRACVAALREVAVSAARRGDSPR